MLKIVIPDSVPMLPQCKTSTGRLRGGNGEVWVAQEDPTSKQTNKQQTKQNSPTKQKPQTKDIHSTNRRPPGKCVNTEQWHFQNSNCQTEETTEGIKIKTNDHIQITKECKGNPHKSLKIGSIEHSRKTALNHSVQHNQVWGFSPKGQWFQFSALRVGLIHVKLTTPDALVKHTQGPRLALQHWDGISLWVRNIN